MVYRSRPVIDRNLVGAEFRGSEDSADFIHVINAHSTHVPVNRDRALHLRHMQTQQRHILFVSSVFVELSQMTDVSLNF